MVIGMKVQKLFPELRREVKSVVSKLSSFDVCKKCPLKRERYVPPERVDSDIILVGEAPGREEVEQGRPFVGQSGRLLRETLKKYGLEKYSVTNVVLCRPIDDNGNNRAPSLAEIRRCREYLKKEIEGYEYIVCVGGIAVNALIGDKGVSDLAGDCIVKDGKKFFVIHHPAYVLRNPGIREDWENQIRFLSDIYYGRVKREIYLVKRLVDIPKSVFSSDTMFLDIETDGLDCERSSILTVAIGFDDGIYVLEWNKEAKEFLGQLFDNKVLKRLVIQNVLFDLVFLMREGLVRRNLEIWDTMVMAYLLDERLGRKEYSLKRMVKKFLREGYTCRVVSFEGVNKESLMWYNGEDVYFTRELFYFLYKKLDSKLRGFCRRILFKSVYPLSEITLNGMRVDVDYVRELKKKFLGRRMVLLDQIHKEYGEINLNSNLQVGEMLMKLGIKEFPKTTTGRMRVDENALLYIKGVTRNTRVRRFVELLLEYRRLEKILSTYLVGVVGKMSEDGRVRSKYSYVSTVTGRLSSSQPNLQNIPRDSEIRSIFVSEEGYCFVEIDFSQIELRVIAHESGDPEMLEAYSRGVDLHTKTAAMVASKDEGEITKEERQKAKACNFGFCYGSGWRTFQEYAKKEYGVVFSDSEAKGVRKKFFEIYSGLATWHKKIEKEVLEKGYVRSMFGRYRRLDDLIEKGKEYLIAEAVRKAINFPIQSAASDINLFFMWLLYRDRGSLDFKFVGTVHDSILLEVREEHFDKFLNLIDKKQEELNNIIKLKVRLEVEVKKGFRWGQGKEVKS